jgi:hypothetical protein
MKQTNKPTAEEMEACLRRMEASLTIGSISEPEIQKAALADIRSVLDIK